MKGEVLRGDSCTEVEMNWPPAWIGGGRVEDFELGWTPDYTYSYCFRWAKLRCSDFCISL